MTSNAPCKLSIVALVAMLLTGCAPAALATPVAPATPATATVPPPLLTVKVMTYNILFGGGRDRALDWHNEAKWAGIDRTPMLRDYFKQVDADILGLEEATGWDEGQPPYISVVADELGMHYLAPPTSWGVDSALLTKYEILESENLSDDVNSFLRAKLKGPDGEPINVFVAHLDSSSEDNRSCGTQLLLQAMQPYFDQRTLLIGDMNANAGSLEWGPSALKKAGWKLIDVDNRYGIDQVWVPGSMQWQPGAWPPRSDAPLAKMSDHNPVGIEVQIYSPSGEVVPNTTTPTPMPELTGLPESVGAAMTNPRIVYSDDLVTADMPCGGQQWTYDGAMATLIRKELHIFGKQDWQSAVAWSKYIPENAGMLLDFKYAAGSEFNIFLEHADWATPEYRRFGMYLPVDAGPFQPDMWQGDQGLGGEPWQGISQVKPATWYRMLLLAGEGGRFRAYVWPVDDPGHSATYSRDMGAEWAGLKWRLSIGANKGGIDVRSVSQIVFDTMR